MEDLTAKQQKAIAALLHEKTIRDAAAACGTSETTLYRWLGEEAFAAAYRDARSKTFAAALTNIQTLTTEAADTLRAVLTDETARPGEKVTAARSILEYALKARDLFEVEARLTQLEKLNQLNQSQEKK